MRTRPHAEVLRRFALIPLTVGLATAMLACGDGPSATVAAPSPASPAPSAGGASSPDAGPGTTCVHVDPATAACWGRASGRLHLPYRQYRHRGSFHLGGLTDDIASLEENTGATGHLWLMELSSGRAREVLTRSSDESGRLYVCGPDVSSGWLVWEEVGEGDDLVGPVDWRLCAARVDSASLTIGKARVIASASNTRATRPMYDLVGDELFWTATTWTQAGRADLSQLTVVNLGSGRRRSVYRCRGECLSTVSVTAGEAVMEQDTPGGRSDRFVVVDVSTGRVRKRFDVGNEHLLSHWPALRGGWLAWCEFPSDESAYPALYLLDPHGKVRRETTPAVDPCFVGPYLFYEAERSYGYAGRRALRQIRALRLSDMKTQVLLSTDLATVGCWKATCGAPVLEHHLVACLDRSAYVNDRDKAYSLIRVYDVE